MLRHKMGLAGVLASLAFLLAPSAGAETLPPTCDQPDYGTLHATLARAGMVGAGGHIPGTDHRGFSGCVRP